MYKEVFTTNQGYVILALYAHSGNEYHYYKVHKDGRLEATNGLNNAFKNDYWLDYVSTKQLETIDTFERLFKDKKVTQNDNDFTVDDIPF